MACKPCSKRYVLECVEDAHCMNCRRGWPRDALIEHFGPTWVSGEYKQRRETLLFDRERAMLPDTQARLEAYRRWKGLKDSIAAHVAERKALKLRLNELDVSIESLHASAVVERHRRHRRHRGSFRYHGAVGSDLVRLPFGWLHRVRDGFQARMRRVWNVGVQGLPRESGRWPL